MPVISAVSGNVGLQMTAAFMGTAFPILSKHLGFDPATTARPFETAFQDVIGFGVFLGLATLFASRM